MGHAVDTLNLRDMLVAEPHRVWFASVRCFGVHCCAVAGKDVHIERETEKR
jgi:hypothetical protein